jgi:hypothetical protein
MRCNSKVRRIQIAEKRIRIIVGPGATKVSLSSSFLTGAYFQLRNTIKIRNTKVWRVFNREEPTMAWRADGPPTSAHVDPNIVVTLPRICI